MYHFGLYIPRIAFVYYKKSSAAKLIGTIATVACAGIPAKADTAIFSFKIVHMGMTAGNRLYISSLKYKGKNPRVYASCIKFFVKMTVLHAFFGVCRRHGIFVRSNMHTQKTGNFFAAFLFYFAGSIVVPHKLIKIQGAPSADT